MGAGAWPAADRALASRGSWDWLAFPHQARVWPELLRAARPALIAAFALLALGGTAFVLLLPSSEITAGDEAEIRLLAEAASPNLNPTIDEASEPDPSPRMPPPAIPVETPRVAVAPMVPPEPVIPVPAPVAAEPPRPLDAGVTVVLIPANAPTLENDAIDVRASHPGDTPMIREWKMLGLQTVLAGALVAATTAVTPAAEPADKGSSDVKKDDVGDSLKALQGQIKALTEAVEKMDGAISKDVKKIQADISRLSGDVLDSKVKADKASKGVEDLTAEVDKLRKELEALRTQVAAGRVSNYPQAPPSGMGRVKIVNTFTTPVTFVVNNKVYRDVMPGETRFTEALPAGTINYEVLGIQTARNTQLDPNEVLTINVFVRQ